MQHLVPWISQPSADPELRMPRIVSAPRCKLETAAERSTLPGSDWVVDGISWIDVLGSWPGERSCSRGWRRPRRGTAIVQKYICCGILRLRGGCGAAGAAAGRLRGGCTLDTKTARFAQSDFGTGGGTLQPRGGCTKTQKLRNSRKAISSQVGGHSSRFGGARKPQNHSKINWFISPPYPTHQSNFWKSFRVRRTQY